MNKNLFNEVKGYFNKLLQSADGLMAIVVTDIDGVPIFKVATEQTPELVLRHNFLGTFDLAAKQASKLGMSKNKSIICLYANYQVFQVHKSPLLLTFIASSDTNTGVLLDMNNDIKDILQEFERVLA